MTQSIIVSVLSKVILAVLSFAVGILGARLKQIKKKKDETSKDIDVMKESLRHLLRNSLKEDHEHYIKIGYCPIHEKEEVHKTYITYHDLGGNGFGTQLHDDIMALPDNPPFKKPGKE